MSIASLNIRTWKDLKTLQLWQYTDEEMEVFKSSIIFEGEKKRPHRNANLSHYLHQCEILIWTNACL